MKTRALAESVVLTSASLVASIALFALFMAAIARVNPVELFHLIFVGGFGTWFSWQDTLTRAAPLILTALCTAIPSRVGLVIIGGEGALVVGGLAALSTGLLFQSATPWMVQIAMASAGMLTGGLLIALAAALRQWRGVNETIGSLLLAYSVIGVFNYLVEGPMRDPSSLNKPSTYPLAHELTIGRMFHADIHWGLAMGFAFCVSIWLLMSKTTFGFAAKIVGGNLKAAQIVGLAVDRIVLTAAFLGGAAAGLAGMVEVAAVHHQANSSLIAGYGFMGILVSFVGRHHPLGIIPVAILFGGISASSGLLQRRLGIPDASVQVFAGLTFVSILLFGTFSGRLLMFQPPLPRIDSSS